MDHRRFKMTDYYIIKEFGTERTLYQKVTQGLNETYEDLSNRCMEIIIKAEKQFRGNFFFADMSYLRVTNQTHLLES